MATQLFNIAKIYVGSESKSNYTYETDKSWEECQDYLNSTESQWRRNGGSILERCVSYLTVEDNDGQVIIFQISLGVNEEKTVSILRLQFHGTRYMDWVPDELNQTLR